MAGGKRQKGGSAKAPHTIVKAVKAQQRTAGLDRTLAHDTYLVASDFILILYRFPVFWRVAEFTEFTLGIGHPAGFSRSGLLQDY
jgi:hypothetical protein